MKHLKLFEKKGKFEVEIKESLKKFCGEFGFFDYEYNYYTYTKVTNISFRITGKINQENEKKFNEVLNFIKNYHNWEITPYMNTFRVFFCPTDPEQFLNDLETIISAKIYNL